MFCQLTKSKLANFVGLVKMIIKKKISSFNFCHHKFIMSLAHSYSLPNTEFLTKCMKPTLLCTWEFIFSCMSALIIITGAVHVSVLYYYWKPWGLCFTLAIWDYGLDSPLSCTSCSLGQSRCKLLLFWFSSILTPVQSGYNGLRQVAGQWENLAVCLCFGKTATVTFSIYFWLLQWTGTWKWSSLN